MQPANQRRSNTIKKRPLLFVDKDGIIARLLLPKINPSLPVILLSKKSIKQQNIVHIPYTSKIPHIPNNHYAHIFVVSSDMADFHAFAGHFVKKASDDHAGLVFVLSLRLLTQAGLSYLSQVAAHSLVAIYGDVFGQGPYETRVQRILEGAKKGRMVLAGHGLAEVYPVLDRDVVEALLSLAEEKAEKGIVGLYPKQGATELTVARFLLKENPLLTIDFSDEDVLPPVSVPTGYFLNQYPLAHKLREALRMQATELPPPKKQKKRKVPTPRLHTPHLWWILIILMLLPIFLFVILAGTGVSLLAFAQKDIQHARLHPAERKIAISRMSIGIAKPFANYTAALASLIGQRARIEQVEGQLDGVYTLTTIAGDSLSSVDKIAAVFQGKSPDPKNDFMQATHVIKQSLVSLQTLEAENRLPATVADKIATYHDDAERLSGIMDSLPWLLGFTGKKTYMVAFQNNMELRPGGGFLGSYALVTLQDGKLTGMDIHDVYDADGQLEGHIDPPFALQRYLGVSHWFLRDSNFFASFPNNATNMMRFLSLETGQNVDGVIGIDVTFLQMLLHVTGPIYVPAFQTTVTADTFYALTEKHAQDNFFPGSKQKQNFLSAVTLALRQTFAHPTQQQTLGFLRVLSDGLTTKHVLVSTKDNGVNALLVTYGLAGSIRQGAIVKGINDAFGLSEANVGTNKVNHYITRQIEHHVILSGDSDVHEQVTITYKNASTKGSFFGGDYNAYIRVIVPDHTSLDAIALDGLQVDVTPAVTDPAVFTSPRFTPPGGLEVDQTSEEGKTLFGFFVTVAQGQEKTIDITYSLPHPRIGGRILYHLHVYKQPGTLDDPYTFSFTYPKTFSYKESTMPLDNAGNSLLFTTPLKSDQDLQISFEKTSAQVGQE